MMSMTNVSTLRSCLLLTTTLLTACSPSLDTDCRGSTDCPGTQYCRLGKCTDPGDPTRGEQLGIDDLDAGTDPTADTTVDADDDHPCPDAEPATADNFLLNEFLANVPAGDDGDANEDGVRHYHDDEFVELVNIGDDTIDITGVTILNGDDERFAFDDYCVEPLHAVVVFGGIEDGADPPDGDGFTSFVSDSWFRYAQGGGHVVIQAADGDTIADVEYGSHPEGSLNLNDDLDGTGFEPHTEVADDDEKLFSPGTCADGRPFTTGCPEQNPDKTPPGT